jgi:transcription elongation GreA/GreB family factor|tara:strand:- start:596 stop:1030 length:435 start_codon:yes stop_codon:yes gene_type:complete
MAESVNDKLLERLERVVDSLQDNSVKMGQLLAVHNEKLEKQDRVDEILFDKVDALNDVIKNESNAIKQGCERDIRLIDERLRVLERKMWSIAGALAVISTLLSPIGQRLFKQLSPDVSSVTMESSLISETLESRRQQIHQSGIV